MRVKLGEEARVTSEDYSDSKKPTPEFGPFKLKKLTPVERDCGRNKFGLKAPRKNA